MSVEKFKEALLNPLLATIQQNMAVTLGQFGSSDDVMKQLFRTEGMKLTAKHIEDTYNALFNQQAPVAPIAAPDVEVLPPQG